MLIVGILRHEKRKTGTVENRIGLFVLIVRADQNAGKPIFCRKGFVKSVFSQVTQNRIVNLRPSCLLSGVSGVPTGKRQPVRPQSKAQE